LLASVILLSKQTITNGKLIPIIFCLIILASILGIFLFWKRYYTAIEILFPVIIYSSFSIVFYSNEISELYFVIGITLHMIAMSFITSKKWLMWLVHLTCLTLVIVTLYNSGNELIDIILNILVYFFFFVIINRLITDLENKLNQSIKTSNELNEKLKIKNNETQMFVNIMAHDIKSPLYGISGFNHLLREKIEELGLKDESIDTYLSYIDESSEQLNTIIDDVLTKAREEGASKEYEKIDLKELIENQLFKLKYQIDKADILIELNDLETIYGDRRSFVILFSNIISNSIKYMPKKEVYKGHITISQTNLDLYNLIKITDNGIGIEEKNLSTIFEPFKKLHVNNEYEGTGLGLSVCKTIVENHNGCILVDSKLNEGTTFQIKLPKNKS